LVTPPYRAVIVTIVSTGVGTVVTPIVCSLAPAATVMDPGTGMSGLLALIATLAPPTGAGSESSTLTVMRFPPVVLPDAANRESADAAPASD
jgi:hypothetical protein